ncbi:hypothetical protein DFH09DRAFT_1083663 [Mycena vulgaris]|nr:hypothetical protein DFH09DRAFT_1083663 [Mycena vulgaris]
MASEDVERSTLQGGFEPRRESLGASPTPSPDPTQSPTSLDFSLPGCQAPGALDSVLESQEEESATDEMMEQRNGKRSMVEGGGGFKEPHKRFPLKVARLTDDSVFRSLAGVRRAILEGLQCVESLVWQRYGVAEFNFPDVYVQHPLLYDSEAARMHTLWSVLHSQQRYTLAGLLFKILTIRLRDDFVISHLLNAGFLDSQYPDVQYWELLPYTETNPYNYPVYEDSDSDDEMLGFETTVPRQRRHGFGLQERNAFT